MSKPVVFDSVSRARLAIEEWLSQEYGQLNRQSDVSSLGDEIRFIVVDGLVERGKGVFSTHSYLRMPGQTWVVVSLQALRRMDYSSVVLFLRLVNESCSTLLSDLNISVDSAEIKAIEKIIHDIGYGAQSKALLQQFFRLRQLLLLTTAHIARSGSRSSNILSLVPEKSDKDLREKVHQVLQRIRSRMFNVLDLQALGRLRIRIVPYFFRFLKSDNISGRSALKVRSAAVFHVTDSEKQVMFDILLLNTYFLEHIEPQDLEVFLAYELVNLNQIKQVSRVDHGMELEIYQMLQQGDRDVPFGTLRKYFEEERLKAATDRILTLTTDGIHWRPAAEIIDLARIA